MRKGADYRDSHTDPRKGWQYDGRFRAFKWRKYLWEREQSALRQILQIHFGGKSINYLDFACGTGRILQFMTRHVDSSTGVDVSESMLNECRKKLPDTEIIQADITRNDPLGDRRFDLITAFRFFPNAQQSLRSEVIQALAGHLSPDGVLVFNNHRNKSSTLFTLARILKSDIPIMSSAEAKRLVASAGLKIIQYFNMGVLPGYDNHPVILPFALHRAADRLANLLGVGKILCQDIIYVCRRTQ